MAYASWTPRARNSIRIFTRPFSRRMTRLCRPARWRKWSRKVLRLANAFCGPPRSASPKAAPSPTDALKALPLKPGLRLYRTALDRVEQEALLADLREVFREAPLYRPAMPRSGKPFSVRMSNCGALGWVSDV